jgi:hypothetical protein
MALIGDALAQGIIGRISYIEKHLADALDGGTDFVDRLTAANPDDPSVLLPMLQSAHNVDLAIASGSFYASLQTELVQGLIQHLQRQPDTGESKTVYATVDAWLTAVTWRVPIFFSTLVYRATGSYLSAAHVYDDVKTQGVYTVSGAGAGSWSAAALEAIDAVRTSGNNLEAYVPFGYAATNVVLNVTGTLPDETTEVKQITVNIAADDATRVVAIGDAADRYIGVDTVEIVSGGVAAEAITIRSKLDRADMIL